MLRMLKMGGNTQHGASVSLSMLWVSGGFESLACQPGSSGQNLPSCKSRNLLDMWLLGQEKSWLENLWLSPIAREKPAFSETRVSGAWNQLSQSGWTNIRSIMRWSFWKRCLKDDSGNVYRCCSSTKHAFNANTWSCLSAFDYKHLSGIEYHNLKETSNRTNWIEDYR